MPGIILSERDIVILSPILKDRNKDRLIQRLLFLKWLVEQKKVSDYKEE
ncbi:MAG: hypothetical protein QXI19_03525 [Candidatus Caldarchaeum sp.]